MTSGDAGVPGDLDGLVHALDGRHAPDEHEVVAAGPTG